MNHQTIMSVLFSVWLLCNSKCGPGINEHKNQEVNHWIQTARRPK